jgi:tRNA A-37 threonylcarbamoyl transferase component Bud32
MARESQPHEQLYPLEREADHALAEILREAELAGFGGNAFVFRIAAGRIPVQLTEQLKSLGEDAKAPDEVAMKMLKVYEPGLASKELRMHRQAWEIMQEVKDDHSYAQIPEVYFVHTASFTAAEQQELNELGFKVGAQADIILMDYIPGRDLKEIMATAVMERSEGATPEQIQRTTDVDTDYAYAFLKKRGWSIHPSFGAKVEKTMKRLNANHLFHRDLHEANIMVDGNIESEDARAYIIDFGAADKTALREFDRKTIDDLMVVRRIFSHQPEKEGEISDDERDYREDLKRYHERARTHELYAKFRERFLHDPEKTMEELRIQDERTLSQSALLLIGAVSERLLTPLEATQAIDRLKAANKNIPLGKKMSWLANYIRDLIYV